MSGDDDNAVRDLLDIVYRRNETSQKSDVYQELMSKEERVLNSVDRVVNATQKLELEKQMFVHMSLSQVWHRTMQLVPAIIHDLTTLKRVTDVGRIFLHEDRKIYVGLIVVGIALIAFFSSVL